MLLEGLVLIPRSLEVQHSSSSAALILDVEAAVLTRIAARRQAGAVCALYLIFIM